MTLNIKGWLLVLFLLLCGVAVIVGLLSGYDGMLMIALIAAVWSGAFMLHTGLYPAALLLPFWIGNASAHYAAGKPRDALISLTAGAASVLLTQIFELYRLIKLRRDKAE